MTEETKRYLDASIKKVRNLNRWSLVFLIFGVLFFILVITSNTFLYVLPQVASLLIANNISRKVGIILMDADKVLKSDENN